MEDERNFTLALAVVRLPMPRARRLDLLLGSSVVLASLLAAIFVPRGYALALFGDALQLGLVAATSFLAFRNFLRSHFQVRIFWLLFFVGSVLWLASNVLWSLHELWFARPVPDNPAVDVLLILKVIPLAAAFLVAPDRNQGSTFRTFGLLDVLILMLYSLYLYVFGVFAFRLLPGALEIYNFRFNLADALGNHALMIVAAIAFLRSRHAWRGLYLIYFFAAACYALASDFSNVAIDMGRYYTGSLYDIPLVTSLVSFVWVALAGRSVHLEQSAKLDRTDADSAPKQAMFVSSHLAMFVALSTPALGIWLLSSASAPPQLRSFRIVITLLTIFLLTLLISIKQDFLTAGLIASLKHLSETYSRIDHFKTHLIQSEKLAALGELVAQVANQIKVCMVSILGCSSRLSSRPDAESRIQNMAGKIAQYALRTDALVDNMLHFAQETPLRLAPVEVKPLIESALHLSRVAKLPHVRVELAQQGICPRVRGDSSQLLHVFIQLISNAVDALEEVGGGTFDIVIRPSGSQLLLEFADSGPGFKELHRLFEPFYTTKPVGKGTGLGLSTCYGIIQQHQGEISCRNRPQGGAVFVILLPCVKESASAHEKAAANPIVEGVQ